MVLQLSVRRAERLLPAASALWRGREGRAYKLLSITVEGVFPRVRLDLQLLPSQAQGTPRNREQTHQQQSFPGFALGLRWWGGSLSVCFSPLSWSGDIAEAVQGQVKLRAAADNGGANLLVVAIPQELHPQNVRVGGPL